MDTAASRDKWNRIYGERAGFCPPVASILAENTHLLPPAGAKALDLACGLGSNALFLARRGFEVDAVDISEAAIQAVTNAARAESLHVNAWVQDVTAWDLPVDRYDVIVIARFLDRSLAIAIMAALKLGGLLYYQTFTETKAGSAGPADPRFLLRDNELLRLFDGLRVRYYRDDARVGALHTGRRDEAFLIAQKPYP